MKYCAFVFFCAGAGALSITEDEGLSIKMPEAISAPKMAPLEKGQELSALDKVSEAPSSAPQKPMIKAKLHKITQFLNRVKGEYEEGTDDQKKAIQTKAFSLIMNSATMRTEGDELCQLLWGSTTPISAYLSWYYCPSLVFDPVYTNTSLPASVATSAPSRLRSALLTKAFFVSMLTKDTDGVDFMLAPSICYHNGAQHKLCGKGKVMRTVPYIGFPTSSSLSEPAFWHCDTTTCIAPLTAWAHHQNYVLTSFGPAGKVVELIIPLSLWR